MQGQSSQKKSIQQCCTGSQRGRERFEGEYMLVVEIYVQILFGSF